MDIPFLTRENQRRGRSHGPVRASESEPPLKENGIAITLLTAIHYLCDAAYLGFHDAGGEFGNLHYQPILRTYVPTDYRDLSWPDISI